NNSSVCVPQELPCEDLESPMNFMAHYSTTNLHLVAAVVHSEIRNHYFVLTKRNMSEWIMYDDSKISVFTMTVKTQEVFDAVDETLKDIIGLESIKRSIKSIIRRHSLNLLRKAVGGNPREEPMNFLFLGGPGTCKTTVARKLAGCLNLAGIIDKNITIEVQRDDLVGAHIGQSEEKTNKVIHSAKGGILFIDEAYTLFKARRVNDFG
uniref:Protein cfxQ homolog n=1 Tax=Saccoglossus kowalevskii TaxID=10224 RepID=A0ABM0M5S9_SACKO